MTQKKLLTNVVVIRFILILLLVFYHAFAIYSGAWKPIEGYPIIQAYWWLDKLSYSFMLQMFVFISGYVFGYQVRTRGDVTLEAKNLFVGKFKRLMIPCIVFSLLYIIIFNQITQPITTTLYGLFNGVGHLWFLPMLYWCFVSVYLIEKMHFSILYVLPLFLIISIFPSVPLPFRISVAFKYIFFFYVGYLLQRQKQQFERFYTSRNAIALFMIFLVAFISLTYFQNNDFLNIRTNDNLIISKFLNSTINSLIKIIISSLGICMLFRIVGVIDSKRKANLPQWLINMSSLCMGVYIFQQFILKCLYDYSSLPLIFGPYLLPWVSFLIALSFSLFFSFLLHQTKIGRYLIG